MNTVQMMSNRNSSNFVGQAAAWLFSAFDHRANEADRSIEDTETAWTFNAAAGTPMIAGARPRRVRKPVEIDQEDLMSAEQMIASIHRRAAHAFV